MRAGRKIFQQFHPHLLSLSFATVKKSFNKFAGLKFNLPTGNGRQEAQNNNSRFQNKEEKENAAQT